LSVGCNRKLDKKIAVFNLPAQVTCPGATPACIGKCYAKKAERCYPSARAKRVENLQESRQSDFVARVVAELTALKAIQVRIHESGDFYDQAYLDKWILIAKARQAVTFLAFTKSFHLDFSKAPENMKIYASVDGSTRISVQPPAGKPTAFLIQKGQTPFRETYTCRPMIETKKHNYCGSDCKHCWLGTNSVQWLEH
jgi:hypothetical protein